MLGPEFNPGITWWSKRSNCGKLSSDLCIHAMAQHTNTHNKLMLKKGIEFLWGGAAVVECLPSMHEVLDLITSTM